MPDHAPIGGRVRQHTRVTGDMPNESDQLPEGRDADWDAIARWLAGESDPAETSAVETWVASHPLDARIVAAVKEHETHVSARAELGVTETALDVEQALGAVRARIAADTPRLTVIRGGAPRIPASAPSTASLAPNRWLGWRGGVLAAAAGLAIYVGASRRAATNAPSVASREIVTKVGQRDSLTLTDGTRIVLAPGSRLTVAAGYGTRTREVTLDGAAYFDVQHNASLPFTVRARGAQINDIGTAFSVSTDAVGGVSVAVTHGIVAIRDTAVGAAGSVELRAGDRGALRNGTVAVTRGSVTNDDVSWTTGHLAYRDTPLDDVRADLQRWYGIDLRVADPMLASRTLTGSSPSDSATATVRWIALLLGADVVQRGDTVFLQPAGRGPTP